MRRKSAQQKIVEGRGAQIGVHKLDSLAAAEPRCESGLLPVPKRLTGDARALFVFFAGELETMDLDKKPDREALACACTSLACAWKAERHLRRQGEVIRVPVCVGLGNKRRVVGHRQQRNRWFSVKVESEKQFARFASAFGLVGPSSRATIHVEE